LALAAAATSSLRLATGICVVPQRDVLTTAKEVASLDVLSGGRVLFGVGAGWLPEETPSRRAQRRASPAGGCDAKSRRSHPTFVNAGQER
jgi:alkanesulfonate monooxygenase SsuD/methylene tetrahydromethanopterin reductase-like flavin-dependent oxidoreductase (luciferase family)